MVCPDEQVRGAGELEQGLKEPHGKLTMRHSFSGAYPLLGLPASCLRH